MEEPTRDIQLRTLQIDSRNDHAAVIALVEKRVFVRLAPSSERLELAMTRHQISRTEQRADGFFTRGSVRPMIGIQAGTSEPQREKVFFMSSIAVPKIFVIFLRSVYATFSLASLLWYGCLISLVATRA